MNTGYTVTMKSCGVGRDVSSKDRLLGLVELYFGTENAMALDSWADSASCDETYEADEFTVVKWEED